VWLHLEIRLDDGTEALSTFGDEPLDLRLGDGTLAPGLEGLLLGLGPGAVEDLHAHGDQLYGPRLEEKIHWLQQDRFPPGLTPSPGQVIAFEAPGGQETAGQVLELRGDRVRVDFNHPLSGRALQIRVEILAVEDSPGARKSPRIS